VVKDERNYAPLRQNGRIYHLERDPALLPRNGRPLSQTSDLSGMYRERLPAYRRFRDAVIDCSGSIAEAAAAIWRDFCDDSHH
jgi:shikimate kinase